MLDWMLMPLRRYAEFSGRSRRKEFWSFFLLNMIVFAVIMGVRFGTGNFMEEMGAIDPANPFAIYGLMFSGVGLLMAVWWVATLVPNVAVTVRRLHDRDMSGWWYLGFIIANFIPLLNLVAGVAFLVIALLPGTAGPNRFGPDPKDPTSSDVFA